MKRGQSRQAVGELREACMIRAGGRCEWPQARVESTTGGWRVAPCGRKATQMAHLHSRGMGGSVEADRLDNVMAACDEHARITDGEGYGAGSATLHMFGVIGYSVETAAGSLAWHRAEALSIYIRAKANWT